MSSSFVRSRSYLAMAFLGAAAAALACGGEQASAVPAGTIIAPPPAHPSPDPPPAVPLILTREDAGDAAADAGSDAVP